MSDALFLNGHKPAQNILDKPWNVVQQYRLISVACALNQNELLSSGSGLTTAKYKPWKRQAKLLKQNGVEILINFSPTIDNFVKG